jgi:hypothetical protein
MIKRGNEKSSGSLSKSTKTLLIVVIAIMLIAVIFLVVRGLSNKNNNETPVDKLTADLQISQVEIVNNTDLNVKVGEGTVEGTMQAINFIFYDENGAKILTRKILSSELEKNDFQISFRVVNTSKIKSISITPVFTSTEGKSVVGQVEDEYTISAEEYPNNENNESNQEENATQTEEQPSCTLDSDCNDNNSCTTDTCVEGNCSYTPIDSCVPCSLSSQCDDSNACTANVCSDGKCSYPAIPGCTPCGSNLNCEDNNSCTDNICFQGRCMYTTVQNCQSCTLDSECDDNEACTTNTCLNGACTFTSISGCKICTLNSQCDDNDSSTTFACLGGKCTYTKITSCKNNDGYCPSGCNAGNDNDCSYICGNGVREGTEKCDGASLGGATCAGVLGTGYTGTLKCFSGLCTFDTSLCVAPCTCSDDGNICTTDQCVNNVCQHIQINNCCTSSSQCGSNQVCTGNVCVATSNPPTATCTDKIQNQGETGVDCGGPCSACSTTYLRIFYVNTTGNDGNSGTASSPWRTLYHACLTATTRGDLISVGVGTFVETANCNLAVGVSIVGTGTGSVIQSTVTGYFVFIISLSSSTENTAGNQSISNLKFDGTNSMGYAVHVSQRGLVNIHDCTFINFVYGAMRYAGQANDGQPTAYAQGNQVYNNIMTDCGTMIVDGYSSFQATGQKDMLFHDNILTLTGKAFGKNSEGMSLHHNMGMKVYNNTITTDPNMYDYYNAGIDMAQYTFVMELWDNEGGFEIYNNHFYNGALDVAGHYEIKGTYPYAVSVHNNTFSRAMGLRREAIELEMGDVGFDDVLIYDNWIENYSRGINCYNEAVGAFSNISIYYNVLNNIGTTDAGNSNYDTWGIWFNGYFASTINNLNIWNNIIIGHVGGSATGGIGFVGEGTYTNVSIKNNIIMNFIGQAPVYNQGGNGLAMSSYIVNNNDFYNNGYGNVVQNQGITPSNSNETSGNIITIPGFISSSNLALAAGSGCINAGTNVGLTTDYLGHSIVGAPDIGAYEYHP